MTDDPAIEWRYDATRSRSLRLLAHGFVAGLGGPLVLLAGSLLLMLPDALPRIGLGPLLFVALLLLVGGPFSMLYLWPMLSDAEQRPTPEAFTAEGGRVPWTAKSAVVAIAAGAIFLGGLATVGVPFDALFALVVALLFSPVLANLFSTVGSIEDGRLTCNGRSVPLSHVTGVRSVRGGNAVVCWVSYARGTGVFVPRLLTIADDAADEVLASLEVGADTPPPEFHRPDRSVRLVLGGAGVLFVGVAIVGARAATDPVVGTYLAGVLGLLGVLFWIAGWRGV